MFPSITELLILAPPILLALTFHEFAHAWTANKLGDPTARNDGRLTLNPLAHLDPIGTLMLFIVRFGWAKPVPVDPRYLRHPRRDMMWIALAGPMSNIILALVCGLLLRQVVLVPSAGMIKTFIQMLFGSVQINLILAFFNLIPLPPLDGSRILTGLLPPRQAYHYSQLEQYGPGVLVMIIVLDSVFRLHLIGSLISPPVRFFGDLFLGL